MQRSEFEHLLQATNDIVIGLSEDHHILIFNQRAEAFYNCQQTDLINKNFFEVFASKGFRSPIDSQFISQQVQATRVCETQNGYGETCTINWKLLPIANPPSKVKLLLVGLDTLFKNNSVANNLVNILNCSPGSLYWKDKNGRYLGCNQFMVDTSGLKSVNDIIGKTDFDLWPHHAQKLIDHDQAVIQSGKTLATEEIVAIASGKLMYFTGIKMPLRDENNHIVGVIGNSLDITALKLAEKALMLAKDDAEQSNLLKTEFIRNMEHDIRTPFSGIYSMAKILEEKETDEEKRAWLSAISECAKQLLDYCNAIVDFSKLKEGSPPLLSKRFNLRQLIADVVALEKPAAEIKKLTISVDYPASLTSEFMGDPGRIQRVLINLASNAVKFTDEGYVKIEISCAKQLDAKNSIIKVCVIDTGIGIAKDKQDIIYEKFNRLSPSNRGCYTGSGLGLTLVKQLIEELDGEIDLHSEPNQGATFVCLLPLKLPLL